MSARRVLACCLLVMFASISIAQAQGAPNQIKAALNDLSSRLGRSIALSSLSSWRWEQQNFDDASMGCESAPGGGGAVRGYKFLLTYNFVTYDYRVTHDSSRVIMCSEMDADQAAAQATGAQYSNTLCPETADSALYMRSRVNVGVDAEAAQGYVNLRAQPTSSSAILMQIPAGLPIRVSGRPECAEGIVWWYALAGNQTGYVAEGQDGTYLIQPARPAPLPDRVVLTATNITALQEVARLSGNIRSGHDWSADGTRLYLPGDIGSDSIWMVQMNQTELAPLILPTDDVPLIVRARPGTNQVLYGSDEGGLHLLEIETSPELAASERLYLNAHSGGASSLAFHPDGNRFLSAGRIAFTAFDTSRDFAAIVWDLPTISQVAALSGHRDLISEIAFSADGTTLVTGSADGTLRYWDAATGLNLQTLDLGAPISTVKFSPDGRMLAVGLASADANLRIYDAATRAQIAALPMPGRGITSLAFNPGSSLLAVGAAGNLFTVWGAETFQPLFTEEVEGDVAIISFSPDGTLIAASMDKPVLALFGVAFNSG